MAIPLVTGFIISRLLAVPIISSAESFSADAFAMSDRQKVEGAKEVHKEELRLRMEASIGRRPALTNDELQLHLHEEAVHLAEEFKEKNKRAYLNVASDSVAGLVFFYMLVQNTEQRGVLFKTLGRVFSGLSDTAKAFIIIAVTDTLLGYHSEEGWTAAIRLISNHYGFEAEVCVCLCAVCWMHATPAFRRDPCTCLWRRCPCFWTAYVVLSGKQICAHIILHPVVQVVYFRRVESAGPSCSGHIATGMRCIDPMLKSTTSTV